MLWDTPGDPMQKRSELVGTIFSLTSYNKGGDRLIKTNGSIRVQCRSETVWGRDLVRVGKSQKQV